MGRGRDWQRGGVSRPRVSKAAGEVNVTLMWGGIKVSMLGSLFGVLILAFASLLWFVLQLRWRLLVADEVEAAAGSERTLAELLLRRAVPHFTAVRHACARDDLVLEVERKLTLGDELLEERLDVLREHLARVRWDLGG